MNAIKASSLTAAGTLTVTLMVMLFMTAGEYPVGYCESTQEVCIAVDGFSSGSNTRCYNETDMNWWEAPYCPEGWLTVEDDLPEPKEEPEIKQELDPEPVQGAKGAAYECPPNGAECVRIN